MFEIATIERKVEKKAVATGKFPSATKSLAILDRFEKQENLGEERKPLTVKENRRLAVLQKAFGEFYGKRWHDSMAEEIYGEACRQAKKLPSYNAADVAIFSATLARFQDEEWFAKVAGLFLSALVNECSAGRLLSALTGRKREFSLEIGNLSLGIDYVGFENRENIVVNGNAGRWAGWKMQEGAKMIVNGSVAGEAGREMQGGEIVLHGDAGDGTGCGMHGGKITVMGDAGNHTGQAMNGGEITVNGNAGRSTGGYMSGGKVTVNGNVGITTGVGMERGEVVVNGDAGRDAGTCMSGGRITVNGNIGSIGESITGGDIYQYEKPLVTKGSPHLAHHVSNGRFWGNSWDTSD